MQKLDVSQVMKLSDKLEHEVWIVTLIQLNNHDKLEEFLKLINKTNLLDEVLQNTKKSRIR